MQTQEMTLNGSKLKQITNASHTAVVTMLLLALRQRARGFSNIPATKEQLLAMNEKVVEEDFQTFWKELQAAGIGSIVYGRRGRPDRFQWHYNLKQIAKIAIEGREEAIKELAKKKPRRIRNQVSPKKRTAKPVKTVSKPVAAPVVHAKAPEKTLHTVQLKNGSLAEFILPSGVSQSKVEEIKQALMR